MNGHLLVPTEQDPVGGWLTFSPEQLWYYAGYNEVSLLLTTGPASQVLEVEVHVDYMNCGDELNLPFFAGDINKDCYVDLLDLAILAGNWQKCSESLDTNCDQYYDPY